MKLWKKSKMEGSSGDVTINHDMTIFTHPFYVNYHLFLIMVTGRWSLSLGERQKYSLDSLSELHTQGNILQYRGSSHSTAEFPQIYWFHLNFGRYHNKDNLENIKHEGTERVSCLVLLISRYSEAKIDSIQKLNPHIAFSKCSRATVLSVKQPSSL